MTCYGDGQVRAGLGCIGRWSAPPHCCPIRPAERVFEQMVDEAIAKDEGQRHINNTQFAGNAQHVFGAKSIGTTGDGWLGHGPPPCRWWARAADYLATDPVSYNTGICHGASAHWMCNFVIAALGRGRELGFPTDALLEWAAPMLSASSTHPDIRRNWPVNMSMPDSEETSGGFTWFTSWEEVLTGWSAQKQTGLLNDKIEMVYWGLTDNLLQRGTVRPVVCYRPARRRERLGQMRRDDCGERVGSRIRNRLGI